jgi:carbamoyltransferase
MRRPQSALSPGKPAETKTVIGVSALYHDAAAAAVHGSEILAAAQEERFSRRKHDPRFPSAALDYCIAQAGGRDQVAAAAFYEDPVLAFDRVLRNTIDFAPATEPMWPAIAASQIGQKLAVFERLRQVFSGSAPEFFIVDHHMSHLASAFYASPFDRAAIVVADGVGEWATTTIASGDGTQIAPITQIHYPHSLGLFYSAFTYHCGLKVNSGEYKLMGLAPYGQPRYVDLILDKLIELREDGSFFLNTDYFGFLATDRASNAAFEELLGCPRREPETPLTPVYLDLAASAQAVLDRAMQGIVRQALRTTGQSKLCLAGGVALNCVTNGKLIENVAELEEIWIQPAAGDAGGALGAALYVAHCHFGCARHPAVGRTDAQKGSLLGPAFSDSEVEEALDEAGLVWHRSSDSEGHIERVAQALADGQIVARFAGRMEFGPRALGNRSILADARRPDGQAHINLRIKFRESWRPFAPAVLADHANAYFDLRQESPYMLLVATVREELREPVDWTGFEAGDHDLMKLIRQSRSPLPAITHIDYSARIQTVDAHRNPGFYSLIERFFEITGCPALINTSFNVRGEPIVCSPRDAVACFIDAGIDLLAIGRFLVYKCEQPAEIRAREGARKHELD